MMQLRRMPVIWIVIAACIIVIPFVTGNYVIGVMCFVAIYGALAVGMGVLLEHAGLMSLAHPTFFGLGAYVSGILAVQGIAPPWAGIIIAACFVAHPLLPDRRSSSAPQRVLPRLRYLRRSRHRRDMPGAGRIHHRRARGPHGHSGPLHRRLHPGNGSPLLFSCLDALPAHPLVHDQPHGIAHGTCHQILQ